MKKLILIICGLFLFGCHDTHIEEMNVYVEAFNNDKSKMVSIKSLDVIDDSGDGNGSVVINAVNIPNDVQYRVTNLGTGAKTDWHEDNIITGLEGGSYTASVRSAGTLSNAANKNFTIHKIN